MVRKSATPQDSLDYAISVRAGGCCCHGRIGDDRALVFRCKGSPELNVNLEHEPLAGMMEEMQLHYFRSHTLLQAMVRKSVTLSGSNIHSMSMHLGVVVMSALATTAHLSFVPEAVQG